MTAHRVDVAEEVRALVARRRAKQSELAAVLGLSQAGISRRLSGTTEFTGSELQDLAEFLDVAVCAFFGEHAVDEEVRPVRAYDGRELAA